tara:strand:+ start:103 stop:435 length:333 start_codon:yes stop_codon:yes gene_type:complete
MAKQISELVWKKRLLIISYEKKDDELISKSLNFKSNNICEMDDRSLELIFFKKFKNKNFDKPKFINGYGIWLLGYDGRVKDFSSDSSILLRLFSLIDSMPMGKNEKINDC